MHFSPIHSPSELEILLGKSSQYQNFTYTYDEPTIDLLKKNFQLKDSLYLIAQEGEKFAAFCAIDQDWWEENYFFLREIFVDPEFQKQGIGEKIMAQCIEHARKKGATGIVTETAFENIPMQKLCEKSGFQKWENSQWKKGITYKIIF